MRAALAGIALLMLPVALPAQQAAVGSTPPAQVLPDALVDKLLKADAATRQHAITLARQALESLQRADALLAQSQQKTLQTTGEVVIRQQAGPRTGSEAGSAQVVADKGSQVLNEALQQRWQIQQQITHLTSAIARLESTEKTAQAK